ncbi:MAG TPA: YajD family HNH nuclease [Dissulfurispiraceae bacterium]|nr:YajD family HNH nuclease [Dissulfurispiraceae bacterium]
MSNRYRSRRLQPAKNGPGKPVSEIVAELKKTAAPTSGYREQSLKIHGMICAKCAREFDQTNRHLLTVHHKDGNPNNNPPDGSNWENLCIHCHDDEHSRGMLGDYLTGGKRR